MARRPTSQDVADLAGVSRSTVSLVLNGRAEGHISAVKQRAVVEAAGQLGYRPNALAMSLRSRRTHTLGLLTWRSSLGYPEALMDAASKAADGAGYLLLPLDVGPQRQREPRAIARLMDRQVDGFLVVAPELDAYRPPEMLAGSPTVLLNCADPDRRFSAVVPDESGAARHAAEILLALGHRRIGLITDDARTLQLQLRVAGVRAALATAGLAGPDLLLTGREVHSGAAEARRALDGTDRPTALVCTRERLALGAVLAANDLGLRIPDDLSVISLEDGEDLAAELVPPVSTVRRPDAAMAERAVAMLLEGLTVGLPEHIRQLSFACPPRPLASTGPAPLTVPGGRR